MVQIQKFQCINPTTIICPSYDDIFSTNIVIKDCFSGGAILKTFNKQAQFQYLKPLKVKYLFLSSMNRFKVTHPWKAIGNTLLMVYDTCPVTKFFTFKLPGGCEEARAVKQDRLTKLLIIQNKISIGFPTLSFTVRKTLRYSLNSIWLWCAPITGNILLGDGPEKGSLPRKQVRAPVLFSDWSNAPSFTFHWSIY